MPTSEKHAHQNQSKNNDKKKKNGHRLTEPEEQTHIFESSSICMDTAAFGAGNHSSGLGAV